MLGARPLALIAGTSAVAAGGLAVQAAGIHASLVGGAIAIFLGAMGLAYWIESRDPLTGVLSRIAIVRRVADGLANCRRQGGAIAVLSIDVERFQAINSMHGQAAGDLVLKTLARRIQAALPRGAWVARMGGDEFLIAMLGESERSLTDACGAFCDRLQDALRSAVVLPRGEVRVRVRAGGEVCSLECWCIEAEELVMRANVARRDRERFDRMVSDGGYARYRPGSAEANSRAARVECEMQYALQAGQLVVVYQPIVDVRRMCIAKCEALLRWRSPSLGEVAPQEFIPIAEKSGQIGLLGRFVIEEACSQLARWDCAAMGSVVVCVNVSASQIRDPSFASFVLESLTLRGVAPGRLGIEITEGVVVGDDPVIRMNLRRLARSGIRVYLDDFGTGFSSLSCLAKLEVQGLKIDKTFVDAMSDEDGVAGRDRRLIGAICALAESMSLDVVAEGVDEEWKAAELERMGVRLMQGYLYSHPVAPECVAGLNLGRGGAGDVCLMESSRFLQ